MNIEEVIDGGYCIGCGVCPIADANFSIYRNNLGENQAQAASNNLSAKGTAICPFATNTMNEDSMGKLLYGSQENVKYNSKLGYYLENYAGYVKTGNFRKNGSSGGMVTWLLSTLLTDGLVDAIIHVKDGTDSSDMYSYQISYSVDDLEGSSKSKYYPIELSKVLKEVEEKKLRYAIVGIPCFIKAVRMLCQTNKVFNDRIIYTVGLVCGHLKSDFFAKSEAWESGIHPENLQRVDFRHELPKRGADDYAIEAIGMVNGKKEVVIKPTKELSTTNWGLGYFKYKACDYCDDVLAETADITVGDAWLPEYVADSRGTNIIIVRSSQIKELIDKHIDELSLVKETEENIVKSQAGGFRHRRDGLQYRLWLNEKDGIPSPTKRLKASDNFSDKRKKIYSYRIKLVDESFVAYKIAEKEDNFIYFKKYMKPFVRKYRAINTTLMKRILSKTKQVVKPFVPKKILDSIKR